MFLLILMVLFQYRPISIEYRCLLSVCGFSLRAYVELWVQCLYIVQNRLVQNVRAMTLFTVAFAIFIVGNMGKAKFNVAAKKPGP